MSYGNFADQNLTAEDRAEIYDQLAAITPDLERALNYESTARQIRLNYNIDGIRDKGCWGS